MKRDFFDLIPIWIMIMLVTAGSHGVAEQVYADPENYYRVHVPIGWNVETQVNGVDLSNGSAYASLLKVRGQGTPQGLIQALARNFSTQWKKFNAVGSGNSEFGRRPGAYAMYSGVNPKGVEAVLKIVATTDNGNGYALFMSAPRTVFASVNSDFDRIEAGFELTKALKQK